MAHFKVQSKPVMSAPNVIPMADIMLVLLIIFMVVTPMLQKGMSVEMATAIHSIDMPNADRDDATIIGISRSGDIYVGNDKTELAKIQELVHDRIVNSDLKTIYIKSDARAKYGNVVKVVDEVRAAGVDNVGLITERNQATSAPPPPPAN